MARSRERLRWELVFFLGVALVTASMLVGWTAMRYSLTLDDSGESSGEVVQSFDMENLPADHQRDLRRAIGGERVTYASKGEMPGHSTGKLLVFDRGNSYVFVRRAFFDLSTSAGKVAVALAVGGLAAIGAAFRWEVRRGR